jgi:LPS O-antigen subunit length determinant protein (WzzB/FepE family)
MVEKTFPLRSELLDVLDQQIEMLTKKTLASFTYEEMSAFKRREQRIRDLQQALAIAGAEQVIHTGVLSSL